MRKYLTEFIGTFFLMLTIVCAVGGGAGAMAPIAIGLALMAMVYAGGHISGAHYNPAVTVGLCLSGGASWNEAPGYIIAQLVGAVLAAVAGEYLVQSMGAELKSAGQFDFLAGTVAEFLGTFALVYVIMNVATAKANEGNSYFGLAIGLTVTAMAYALGGITGGAFNPAVMTGLITGGMTSTANIAPFLIGQLLAAAAAAYAFKYLTGKE